MKKTNEQIIIAALKDYEAGIPVVKICKELKVSLKAFYYWKSLYTGMTEKNLKQYKQLISENKRLKRRCEEYNRLLEGLVEISGLKRQSMTDRKIIVKYLMKQYNISIFQACKLLDLSRSTFYYGIKKEDEEIQQQ